MHEDEPREVDWLFAYRVCLGEAAHVEFVTASIEALLGCAPQQLVGGLAGMTSCFTDADRRRFLRLLESPPRSPHTLALTMVDAGGLQLHTSHAFRPQFDAGGRVVALEAVVSRRAGLSKLPFDFIVESLNEGILVCRLDGQIIYANHRMGRILGYERHEMLGESLFSFMRSAWAEQARENLERRSRGIRETFEHQFRHKAGHPVLTRVSTQPVRQGEGAYETSLVAISDITERARAIRRLAESERSFRTLIENSPEAIAIHRDRELVYVNPALVELLGYDSDIDLLDVDIATLVDPADWPQVRRRIERVDQTGDALFFEEERFVRADGERVDVETTHFSGGFRGAPAVISVARDLTRRKQLQAKMMQLDRLVAAGTLAAGVGHEINNPLAFMGASLTYARQNLEILDETLADLKLTSHRVLDGGEPVGMLLSETRDALDSVERGTQRIKNIVRDLKLFSRDSKGPVEPVDVQEVLETAIDMAWSQIEARAEFCRDYESVSLAAGHASGLGQVLLNLLINAAQAIPDDHVGEAVITAATRQKEDRVVIEVRDTGAGIPKEHMAKIFDPFFTTKAPDEGTGLGLSISKRLIEQMGGELQVESDPGEGTLMRICLSAAAEDGPAAGSGLGAEFSEADEVRVLVIDDEVELVAALARSLVGQTVVTATDVESALELIDREPAFDVILCDLRLPGKDAKDLYEELARDRPELLGRMVFMTGGAYTERARAFIKSVPNRCLQKPFTPAELLSAIRRVRRGEFG